MAWVILSIGLVTSNYFYQSITNHNWEVAFERSFFQVFAVIVVFWLKPWE